MQDFDDITVQERDNKNAAKNLQKRSGRNYLQMKKMYAYLDKLFLGEILLCSFVDKVSIYQIIQ